MNASNAAGPGLAAEVLGKAAYVFAEVQPFLPMYLHLILSALFPIFTGAHASLVRPSSAAKPPKKAKKESSSDDQDSDSDDDDDDDGVQKMEGMSPSDAIVFPVLAGCTLGGLYLLIKWMGASLLNKILRYYFSTMAIFGVSKLLADGFAVAESFCWPNLYADEGVIWRVDGASRRAVEIGEADTCERASPLPGILGRLTLASSITNTLWFLRQLPNTRFIIRLHLAKIISLKLKLTLRTIICTILGLIVVVVSNFFYDAWWLTNLQGFAFSYSALQLMSPTTFSTGSLILSALFFYDIYFVFYTPIMVAVATNLDVPIKLLFPRPAEEGETIQKLAMLGLGDIVLPGIMIGLALRFDLYMHYLKQQQQPASSSPSKPTNDQISPPPPSPPTKPTYIPPTGHWGNRFWTTTYTGRSLLLATPPPSLLLSQQPSPALRRSLIPSFPKPYFYAGVAGYVAGMCATLCAMQMWRHAQPALLYLVPGVLCALWGTGVVRGEVGEMWRFSEASSEEDEETKREEKEKDKHKTEKGKSGDNDGKDTTRKGNDDKNDKAEKGKEKEKSWWSKSFFSLTTSEKNAKVIEKRLAKSVVSTKASDDDDNDNARDQKTPSHKDDVASEKKTSEKGRKTFFFFSIKRQRSRASRDKKKRDEEGKGKEAEADEVKGVGVRGVGTAVDEDLIQPRWRGARSSEEERDERAGKRLRTR